MIRIIFGIILGVAAFIVFMFFGGGEYLKKFGRKTEEVGTKIESYEKGFKESVGKAKEAVKETKEKAAGALDKTKKKVKEFMPEGEK